MLNHRMSKKRCFFSLTGGGCYLRVTNLDETWWKLRFCTDMKIPVYRTISYTLQFKIQQFQNEITALQYIYIYQKIRYIDILSMLLYKYRRPLAAGDKPHSPYLAYSMTVFN